MGVSGSSALWERPQAAGTQFLADSTLSYSGAAHGKPLHLQAPAPCRGDVSVGTGPEPCVGVQLEPGIVLAISTSASSSSSGVGTALYPPCRECENVAESY